MTDEYRQVLKELEKARANYDETPDEFEAIAYHELKAAEERVMVIIRKQRMVRK